MKKHTGKAPEPKPGHEPSEYLHVAMWGAFTKQSQDVISERQSSASTLNAPVDALEMLPNGFWLSNKDHVPAKHPYREYLDGGNESEL